MSKLVDLYQNGVNGKPPIQKITTILQEWQNEHGEVGVYELEDQENGEKSYMIAARVGDKIYAGGVSHGDTSELHYHVIMLMYVCASLGAKRMHEPFDLFMERGKKSMFFPKGSWL